MIDAINLSTVIVHSSPTTIAVWPPTIEISSLSMRPAGGLAFTFSPAPPARWKWYTGGAPEDHFLFTVWAIVRVAGVWQAAGFVQMWSGRAMGDGSLPPILSDFVNWWGDVRHLWDVMSDYVPQPGDPIGFFVSAGNGRLRADVSSVSERSNVVLVHLPAGDAGDFTFGDAPPPPPPAPPAPPLIPYDEDQVKPFALDVVALVGQDAGRVGVNCARMQWDVNDGDKLGYTGSRAKHLRELRAELGLP